MSSTRRSRNNAEKGVLGMNDNEIQEEMLNADLKALGISEDELSNMALQEKQNLLTAIKQSTSPHSPSSNQKSQVIPVKDTESLISHDRSPNYNTTNNEKNEIEISLDSPEEYPSLPSVGSSKEYNRHKQQFQQKRQQQNEQPKKSERTVNVIMINSNHEESNEDSGDEYVSDEDQCFSIPGFIDDSGEDLNDSARKKPVMRRVHYYTLPGQTNRDAVRSMLRHYNSWYRMWCAVEKCNIAGNETGDGTGFFLANNVEPDLLNPLSPECSALGKTNNQEFTCNNRNTPLKKASSPDIEEIEITEVKSPMQTPKGKAKTLPRETRRQNPASPNSSSTPTIALNFNEKWDPQTGTGTWANNSYSSTDTHASSYSDYNQKPTHSKWKKKQSPSQNTHYQQEPAKTEPKVQCPICQLEFLLSKVESHAAGCEGFPPETRASSVGSPFSTKVQECNTKSDVTSNVVMECNSDPSTINKKRGN